MPLENNAPKILASARTAQGVAFQLRHDAAGTLDVPAIEQVLVGVHAGAPARLSCRRGSRKYSGTAVPGDIDIIPALTPSQWIMHDGNDKALLVALPQALLQTIAHESGLDAARVEILNRFQIRDMELESLTWIVKREIEAGQPSGRLYLDGLTLAMASRLVMQHSSVAKFQEIRNEGLSGHRLKRVLLYIEEHLARDISLEEIAITAGISASHLKTLFRASMGVPVHQYVIQRRIERAKTLMAQNGMSMAEIALASGFAHQSHMARHIRRSQGVSPRAMKRLLHEMDFPA